MSNIAQNYIGITKTMNCGMKATIITYRTYEDVDVQFEDGIIREHIRMDSFKKGHVTNPNLEVPTKINSTSIMNCGMKASIIAYRNAKNIDIQFEDGTVREHVTMGNFKRGLIPNPNLKSSQAIGLSKIMNCGMKATIIAYRNRSDMDVQFDDDTICEHVRMYHFTTCEIGHPTLRTSSSKIVSGTLFNCYKVNNKAFVFQDTTYFDVSYILNDMSYRDIMSIQDMKNKLLEYPDIQKIIPKTSSHLC